MDNRWQDAPVEQEGGEHAHDERDRQGLEGQDELAAGCLQLEGEGASTQVSEDKGSPRPRGGGDSIDGIVDPCKGCPDRRHLQQENDETDRQAEPKPNRAPWNRPAALGQSPCTGKKGEDNGRRPEIVREGQADSPSNVAEERVSMSPTEEAQVCRNARAPAWPVIRSRGSSLFRPMPSTGLPMR